MALSGALPSSLPKTAKKSKSGAAQTAAGPSSSSPSATFAARLSVLQESLSSSTDLNPLADVVNLVQSHANDLNSSAIIPALTLIVRTFKSLIERASLQPWPAVRATGFLAIEAEPAQDQVVHSWLKERFNDALRLLAEVVASHPKEKTRSAALNALMELQRATTEAGAATPGGTGWSECPWRLIVDTILSNAVSPELRAAFVQDWVEKYTDVKLALLRSFNVILSASTSQPAPPRSAALSLLVAMTNPPSTKSAIKSSEFLVKTFASAPEPSTSGAKSGKGKGSKAAAAKKKRKITQDGDSEASGSDDEDDGVIYFSDSSEDDDDNTAPSRLAESKDKNGASSRKRRRGGMATMPFHSALYEVKAWRASTEAVWLSLILQGGASPHASAAEGDTAPGLLTLGQVNTILRLMEKRVLPYLSRPQLIADWLLDCLDVGGSTALLSLSPLYSLYISASLSLPTLYTTLYGLLTPALLHSPHRSHSLRLLNLFLSSEKLSLATVAAFVKRLARCALRGPPGGIIPVVVMTYNLLKRHREGMALLHRDINDDEIGAEGWKDPYEEDAPTCPPAASKAVDSSLFEFVSLGAQPSEPTAASSSSSQRDLESHYHSPTSTLVRMLAQPFTKTGYDLEEFLDHGYGTLLATEIGRTLDEGPAAVKKRQRLPAPAVRFSVPGATVRVRGSDGKKQVKMPRVFPRAPAAGEEQVAAAAAAAEGVAQAEEHLAEGEEQEEEEEEYDGVDETKLDDEEREAREAMREVKYAEKQRRAAEAAAIAKRKAEESRLLKEVDTMGLWQF